MKSDVFVEQDPYTLNHRVEPPRRAHDDSRPKKQHSAASWIVNGHGENMPGPQQGESSRMDDRPRKPTIDTAQANQQNSPHNPTKKFATLSPLSSNAVLPAEYPLAPLPSNTTGTRQPSMSASSKLVSSPGPTQRAGSASTEVSMPFTPSTDHHKSVSTAATSTASSNRASDNVYTQQATARDGAWMKQEVEKHRQAQSTLPSIATTAGAAAVLANDALSRNTAGSRDGVLQQGRRESTGPAEAKTVGTRRPLTADRSSSRYSGSSWNSQMQSNSPTTGNGLARHGSNGSRRHSRPSSRLSFEGIHETKTSPIPSPRSEEVPPVPRLDAIRLNSLTCSVNHTPIASVTQQQPPQHQRELPTSDRPTLAPAPQNAGSRAADASTAQANSVTSTSGAQTTLETRYRHTGQNVAANTSKSVQQPNIAQNDFAATTNGQPPSRTQNTPQLANTMASPTVVVRDFYRPKPPLGSEMAAQRRSNDPTPADFEALMQTMDGAVHGMPAPAPDLATASSSLHANGNANSGMPVNVPARRSSLGGSMRTSSLASTHNAPPLPRQHKSFSHKTDTPSEAPTSRPPPPQGPDNAGMVNGMSSQNHRASSQADSTPMQQSNRSSTFSPTGASEAHSSQRATSTTANRRERKGLSKILWKMGGGELPQRRKIYVPQYAGDGKYWEEDEDEACAAPVVGFGRGW